MAVNGADATPEAFVATVMVAVPLLKVPDAPEPGAVNITLTPDTGLLPASLTVTARALAKAVLTDADCGVVPVFAVIEEAAATTVTTSVAVGVVIVPNSALMVTVLLMAPLAFEATETGISKLAVAPAAMLAAVHVTVCPTLVQPGGIVPTGKDAGTTSVSVTAAAAPGPSFFAEMVKLLPVLVPGTNWPVCALSATSCAARGRRLRIRLLYVSAKYTTPLVSTPIPPASLLALKKIDALVAGPPSPE